MSSPNYGQPRRQQNNSIDLSNAATSPLPPPPPRPPREAMSNASPQRASTSRYASAPADYDSKIAPELDADIWNSSMTSSSPVSIPPPLPRATQLTPSKQLSQQVSSGGAALSSPGAPIDSHVVTIAGSSSKKNPSIDAKLTAAVDEEYKDRFKGRGTLRHAIWAHYLAYGAAIFCFFMGTFALLYFKTPNPYKCTLNGQPIAALYFNQTVMANGNNGNCNNQVVLQANNPTQQAKLICCYPNKQRNPPGSLPLGALYVAYSFVLVLLEDTNWGFGLYYPADSLSYRYKISPSAIVNVGIGVYGLTLPITIMASFALFILAIVQSVTVYKEEAGDGGRAQRRSGKGKSDQPTWSSRLSDVSSYICGLFSCRITQFYRRILNEDKLSTYVWLFIFLAANAVFFIIVLIQWYGIVSATQSMLLNGTLPLTGNSRLAHMYRKSVRYGPPTTFAAWAKASGSTLNMDCALILIPVTKLILRRLNNIGQSFSKFEQNSSIFARFFALPFYRYVPLSKNLEFHKLCAFMIFVMSAIHIICHYCNLAYANQSTVTLFRDYLNPTFAVFKWDYAAFFTGSVVTLAMLCIYTSALEAVRMAKYEIFYKAHHCFTVFYLFLFIHGPFTFYWTIGPVLLYLYERYLESQRGKAPFVLCKVDYVPPVMCVYFRPIFKVCNLLPLVYD